MTTLTSTELLYPSESKETFPARRKGLLKIVIEALTQSRQRQAEREIARYIHLQGGKMTDDLERRIEERLMRG